MGKKQKTKQGGPNILHSPEWPSPEQTKPGKLFLNKDGRGASVQGDPETLTAHSTDAGNTGFLLLTQARLHVFTENPETWVGILRTRGSVEVGFLSTSATHHSAPIA